MSGRCPDRGRPGQRGLAVTFALTALTTFGVAVAVAFGVGLLGGYRWLTVLSGSMAPQMKVGDLIVGAPLRASELRAGHVVTFRDSDDGSRLITHRVRSVERTGDVIEVVTKGDRNNAVETWRTDADGKVGLVVARIPMAGRLVSGLSSRAGRLGVLTLILCWAAYETFGQPLRIRRRVGPRRVPPVPPVPPLPAEPAEPADSIPPIRVERRVSATGVIVICRQPIRLGRTYAGRLVIGHVTGTTVTVELDDAVRVVQRTTTLPVRNVKASRPRNGTVVCRRAPAGTRA